MDNPNYCSICGKVVPNGRTYAHSQTREHLKLLMAKLKAERQT